MGFYGSLFFRSWLVVAHNVDGSRGRHPKVSMIVSACSAEEACDMVKRYLTDEGFEFGLVSAYYG